MKWLCASICIVLLGLQAVAEPTHPHVVLILADDLGYGDVRCFNAASKIPTPNLDRLAAEGTRFTDMHSGSSVCTPTRYGIMTGRYSWRSTLQHGVLLGLSQPLLAPEHPTIASALKAQGYETAAIGKWHLGLGWTYEDSKVNYAAALQGGPVSFGFDSYFGIPASLDMPPYVFVNGDHVLEAATGQIADRVKPLYWRGGPIAPGFKHDEVQPALTQKAVERIQQHAAKAATTPLFLYLALASPHTPVLPSAKNRGRSGLGDYGDFVCDVDDTVGAVMAALEAAKMADDTLLFFTSDNGFAPYAGLDELRAKGHDPCGGLRGTKADVFEGGHRVPFIARWPKHVPAGGVRDDVAWLGDIYATVATPPSPEAAPDSVSLLPALLGKESRSRGPIVNHSSEGFFAIREGNWKFIMCAHSGGWSAPKPTDPGNKDLPQRQLYDLSQDLREEHNLVAEHPEIVERMTNQLQAIIDNGRSTPGPTLANDAKIEWQRP